jgi:hypothetical protein
LAGSEMILAYAMSSFSLFVHYTGDIVACGIRAEMQPSPLKAHESNDLGGGGFRLQLDCAIPVVER